MARDVNGGGREYVGGGDKPPKKSVPRVAAGVEMRRGERRVGGAYRMELPTGTIGARALRVAGGAVLAGAGLCCLFVYVCVPLGRDSGGTEGTGARRSTNT